ncbi:MAG: polymerase III subunit delta protein [Parcubacteria group bacterium GW2011_GWA2_51_10]|nr:MAG: polymerase III subunit delta protein [Parcubacteria group bacterium GW2011_GWA2_51_10]
MDIELIGNVHLVAGGNEVLPRVLEFIEERGTEVHGNPDVFLREYVQFGIDDARDLRSRASLRAIGKGGHRVFIILCPGMNIEAQNALLKTLEEPSAGADFFFIMPSPETLLPTVRSRAQTLQLGDSRSASKLAYEFLDSAIQERLELIKPLLTKEDDDNEEHGARKRDIGKVIEFLASLERVLSKKEAKAEMLCGIQSIYRARRFAGDKGAHIKQLLEHVALLVPRIPVVK